MVCDGAYECVAKGGHLTQSNGWREGQKKLPSENGSKADNLRNTVYFYWSIGRGMDK